MKKRIIYLLSVFVFATLIITSCKDDEDTTMSVSQMLIGKWQMEYMKIYFSGVCVDSTFFTVNDYVDIRNDGKTYSYVDGDYDTSTYKVVNDKMIIMDNTDTMTISSISSNSLLLTQAADSMAIHFKMKK